MSNSRSLKMLDRIQAASGLSEEGKLGLIQLINPIMDFEQRRVGFAGNADESASVVQCIKRSVTLTAPAGTVTTWDAHIFNTPMCVPNPLTSATRVGNLNVRPSVPTQTSSPIGPFVCLTTPSGNNLGLIDAATNAAVVAVNPTYCPDVGPITNAAGQAASFFGGTSQVIAMGFEIHDTTAEIYKQGTATVYRQPQTPIFDTNMALTCNSLGSVASPTSITQFGVATEHDISDAPRNVAAAMLLHGSRQWEAKEGAYVVPSLIDSTIPVTDVDSVVANVKTGIFLDFTLPGAAATTPAEQCSTAIGNVAAGGNLNIGTVATLGNGVSQSVVPAPLQKFNNFNTSGVILSNLNANASFVVTTIMYIERYPGPADLALVVLANPSPKLDLVMMDLYSSIMRELPVACKVADNADGDWFFEGVSALSRFLSPAMMAAGGLGIPGGALALAADQWAQGKLKERNKVKKNQNQNQKQKATARKPKGPGPASTWVPEGKQVYQKPGRAGGWEGGGGTGAFAPGAQRPRRKTRKL